MPKIIAHKRLKQPNRQLQIKPADINFLTAGLNAFLTNTPTENLQVNAPTINFIFSLIVDFYQPSSEEEQSKKIKAIIQQLPQELQDRLRAAGHYLDRIQTRTDIPNYFEEANEAEVEEEPIDNIPPTNTINNATALHAQDPHLTFAAQFPLSPYERNLIINPSNQGCNP